MGRPLKYQNVGDLDMAIQLYFDKQDPHVEEHMVASGVNNNGETMFATRKVLTEQKPYTMSGLARALGISRQTLLDYSQKDDFLDSIRGAKHKCEEFAESQLFGPFANGAKFNLINNYRGKHQDWSDKQEVDHTSKGERIEQAPIVISQIATRHADDITEDTKA